MRRLLAFLAAAAMIGGALYVRSRGEDTPDDGPDPGPEPGEVVTMACVTELRDVCQALEDANDDLVVTVQDPDATIAALAARDSGFDGWLTLSPWPELAQPTGTEDLLGDPSAPLGQARIGIVIWTDREAALLEPAGGVCTGRVTWKCLGDAADRPWTDVGGDVAWGKVRVGHSPPSTASGQLVLGAAAAGFFGTSAFASNDFDEKFQAWLSRLEAAAGDPSPLGLLLQQGRAAFAAVGATEAEIETQVEPSRVRDEVTVLYPEPVATAYLVLAPVTGARGADRLDEILTSPGAQVALSDAGWQRPPAAPAPSGLPSPGVLIALRARWEEIVG